MTIDAAMQAQIDTQLLELGAFVPLEFLLESGRLSHEDYERWRRREIDHLDEVLMGNPDKIRAQLESAAGYARGIGLLDTPQTFNAWTAGAGNEGAVPLQISADPSWRRLIGSRFTPPQAAPQMDLFFDNPVVVLTNGIVRALAARDVRDAQRQLDRLYAQAPNHADLAAFDRLLAAARRRDLPSEDPRRELEFLQDIVPSARRLLGWEARDLLAPLWRRLADALGDRAFSGSEPNLHRSYALLQAQDWPGTAEAVRAEREWWLHVPLCLRFAHSSFQLQRRADALQAWFHLCWRMPEEAAAALEDRRQPDTGVAALWRRFIDAAEELAVESPAETPLNAADFPAWLLLREPGLNRQLAARLAAGDSPAAAAYGLVHRWIDARREGRGEEELAVRRKLQAERPMLFRQLKRSV